MPLPTPYKSKYDLIDHLWSVMDFLWMPIVIIWWSLKGFAFIIFIFAFIPLIGALLNNNTPQGHDIAWSIIGFLAIIIL